jgi:uncharacterized DUF497 family protein
VDEDFVWDEDNIDHVAAHGVTPTEAEDAILDPRAINRQARSTPTERRYAVIGASSEGRVLFVVYTVVGDAYRVTTAYERRQYRRGRK